MIGTASGLIVITRPKTAQAVPILPIFFAAVSLGLLISGLVQEAQERRRWEEKINDWQKWRRHGRRNQSQTDDDYLLARKSVEIQQEQLSNWQRRQITGVDDKRIDVHDLFMPDVGLAESDSSVTRLGSEIASIDLEHLHRYAHGGVGELNEYEALSVGHHFASSGQVGLAPVSRRRLPLILSKDQELFSAMRQRNNSPVEKLAEPHYSRDFVSQSGRVYTGFAVEWNALKRHMLDGLVGGFKASQRDRVRAGLRYALVFARRFAV